MMEADGKSVERKINVLAAQRTAINPVFIAY